MLANERALVEGTDRLDGEACPECDGPPIPGETETICEDCGLVLDEYAIDHGPEWRPFEVAERERTGPPRTSTRHDNGLGTEIGHGPGLPSRQRREHDRAKFRSKAERNRALAFTEIRRLTERLDGPDVARETACQLFAQAQDADLILGRSLEGMATAATVAALRIHDAAAPFAVVDDMAQVDEKHVRVCYRALVSELGVPVPPPAAAHHVPRLCEAVGVGERERTRAEQLTREHANALQGRNPAGVAAAAVYLAAGKIVNQAPLADAADVSTITLRSSMRVMEAGDE
jgi:transcription initiation factor TFIIB